MRLCLKEMIPIAKKRKNGEGTLRLRKDGRWEGRIVVGYSEKSLPITKCVTAKTKTECSTKLEALKEQYGRSSDRIKADMPFGDWIDFWYQTYCRHTLRITTRTDYENRIYNHIIPEIGKILLNRRHSRIYSNSTQRKRQTEENCTQKPTERDFRTER